MARMETVSSRIFQVWPDNMLNTSLNSSWNSRLKKVERRFAQSEQMTPMVAALSEEDMANLADFYASQQTAQGTIIDDEDLIETGKNHLSRRQY